MKHKILVVRNKNKVNLDHCDQEATCGCEECEEIFCSNCFQRQHTSKKFKTHKKTDILVPKPKCINHSFKTSEVFCFDDNCCLCSTCALLKHKDHNILFIQEATEKIQKEMESISIDEEIKNIEESIEEINENISKRNEKFEKELKELKNQYEKDLIVFDDSNLK
jgi:DNA repair exonuclease SbcCD ATPase subunit